ncbi:MAG: hypothetical protein ABEJ65_09815, partial [bacterium]
MNRRFSCSNIIWEHGPLEDFFALLKENEFSGWECSITKVWENPTRASDREILDLRDTVQQYDLTISAAHSLTFTRPELSFFESPEARDELMGYVVHLAEIADKLDS